jgi:squalene synthase HpnC
MLPVPDRPEHLARAYAASEALARSHYENFPVASRLLPPPMRRHVAAVYAFARVADDIADEGAAPPAERLTQLDAWQRRLHAAVAVEWSADTPTEHEDLIVVALAHSIRSLDLPIALFDDLLSAFAQDTMTTRYGSWDEVLDYCRRSANPVGRLVLRVCGYAGKEVESASDAVCTALQLTNFWQDLEIDWAKGRLYVPASIWQTAGARESDLDAGAMTLAWRQAVGDAASRTRALFERGRPVCDAVDGRLRFELRATWLGGTRILDKLEAANFDVRAHRPKLSGRDVPAILWGTLAWTRDRGSGIGDQGSGIGDQGSGIGD